MPQERACRRKSWCSGEYEINLLGVRSNMASKGRSVSDFSLPQDDSTNYFSESWQLWMRLNKDFWKMLQITPILLESARQPVPDLDWDFRRALQDHRNPLCA